MLSSLTFLRAHKSLAPTPRFAEQCGGNTLTLEGEKGGAEGLCRAVANFEAAALGRGVRDVRSSPSGAQPLIGKETLHICEPCREPKGHSMYELGKK